MDNSFQLNSATSKLLFCVQTEGTESAASSSKERVRSEPDAQERIEYIGSDANTYHQSLHDPSTSRSAGGVPLPLDTAGQGSPDTKGAYEALAVLEALQEQLM